MNLADTQSLMVELAIGVNRAHVEVGLTDRPKHNDAFLKLTSFDDPDIYAIVSTNGSGTYELSVAGGFSTGRADDQAIDEEDVREYLASYLRAAIAYIDGQWVIRGARLFRSRTLTIQTGGARLNLAQAGRWSINSGPEF